MNELHDLERNKELVRRLFVEVIDGGDLDLADDLLKPGYVQHNPSAEQDVAGFKAYMRSLERTKRLLRADSELDIHHVLAEGDRVLIHTETRFSGVVRLRFETMDLFRVEGGRLAEHWDVIQGRSVLSVLAGLVAG